MHPKRQHIHVPATLGDHVADLVVAGMGSWKFIIIQTAIVCGWIAANLWFIVHPFDPFPFILLNLLFSTQAAYASPLILMASNRQATKDRVRDDTEADEVEKLTEMNVKQLMILERLQQLEQQYGELATLLARIEQKLEAYHVEATR